MKEGEHKVVTGFPDAFVGRIIRAQTSAAIIAIAVMPPLMIKIHIGSSYSTKQPALEGPPFKRYTCRYKGKHVLLNSAPGSITLANSKIAKT